MTAVKSAAAETRCPCGTELASQAAQAHGVCDYCRVDAKKRVPPRNVEPAPTLPLFDEPEHAERALVPLDGWPDYRAQGLL